MQSKNIVLASEIADYVYCKRSWWLRFTGRAKANYAMELGTQRHNELSDNLSFFSARKIAAISLILVSLVLIIIVIALIVL
jgi:CRISPR/Cas system-associated exonuclease Cas4 (RecB family)